MVYLVERLDICAGSLHPYDVISPRIKSFTCFSRFFVIFALRIVEKFSVSDSAQKTYISRGGKSSAQKNPSSDLLFLLTLTSFVNTNKTYLTVGLLISYLVDAFIFPDVQHRLN